MRDTTRCRWQRWRVTLAGRAPQGPVADRFTRQPLTTGVATEMAAGPDGDGIRHELVARVRAGIEAGMYDTEEKWMAAEELLIRNVTRGW